MSSNKNVIPNDNATIGRENGERERERENGIRLSVLVFVTL